MVAVGGIILGGIGSFRTADLLFELVGGEQLEVFGGAEWAGRRSSNFSRRVKSKLTVGRRIEESSRRSRTGAGLRESKPKFKGQSRCGGNAGVDGGRVDGGSESKAGDIGWASGNIGGNSSGNGSAEMITESETNEVVDVEKSGADTGADTGRFEGSVAGAARNVVESGD
jgi:hypothetical protein